MPILPSLEPARRGTAATLVLAALVLGCANAGGDAGGSEAASAEGVTVDPCTLFTNAELAEELLLSVSPSQRAEWTTSEFTLSGTPATMGEMRTCEYTFASRHAVGGTAASRGSFGVAVSPANLVMVPQNKRLPVPDGGSEMFRVASAEHVYYVIVGNHAVTIRNFPDRSEGGADAGRIALLRRAVQRLP